MSTRDKDSRLSRSLRSLYFSGGIAKALLAAPVALRRKYIDRVNAPAMKTAENAARRIGGDVVLDLPEFAGRFACSPKSHLFRRIILHDRYEPEVTALIRKHIDPQRDMIDVGANVGFFTMLGASLLRDGRVLAIEPSAEAFARLSQNITANGRDDRVIAFNGAATAGAGAGQAILHEIAGKEEYASMKPVSHPATKGDSVGQSQVQTSTIDLLSRQHSLSPGLIKIDVEGAEALVLEGAAQTLAQHRPVILCELARDLLSGFGSSPETIIAMIEELDYQIMDAADPARAPDTRMHGEILCMPR
ncbi:hypothetical protein GCM10023115_06390 [Pontixanthobacter gangjinensis]|uniref:FkbM family methyltransferase n=1 Tax=Pontixanthobacter gangjinensis TaxID=1028742 RepID=A0A6I4SKA6_9SPHN|nr:FkbM family methyltransferase [Pontixanthobacter gangjinensis]MXO55888.1 FkbM family methyltransferase [Pontixanthobacter gangjinensis]